MSAKVDCVLLAGKVIEKVELGTFLWTLLVK